MSREGRLLWDDCGDEQGPTLVPFASAPAQVACVISQSLCLWENEKEDMKGEGHLCLVYGCFVLTAILTVVLRDIMHLGDVLGSISACLHLQGLLCVAMRALR